MKRILPALVALVSMMAAGGWVVAQEYVGKFLGTFREFPPSQKPGSFSVDQAQESLQKGTQGGGG